VSSRAWPPALLLLAALPWAGCSGGGDVRPQRVAVGVAVAPASWPGAELAVQEINAAGGVRGVPMALVGEEWNPGGSLEPEVVLNLSRRLAGTDDLVAVVGHSDSSSTLAAAAVYNQYRIPQLVTIATNPAITNIGPWTYRLCSSDAVQAPALADYAVESWGKRRIAVFYVNDDYGQALAQLFEQRVERLGGEIVASRFHRNVLRDDDREAIRETLRDLARAGAPDLIFLVQRLEAADWTIGAIREAGLPSAILGADNLSRPALLDHAVANEGVRVSEFYRPDSPEPRASRFREAYRRRTGREPDYGSTFAYDAVYLVRDAVAFGGASREGVKRYLDHLIAERVPVVGAGGAFTLGVDHDSRRMLYVIEVHDGSFRPVATLPTAPVTEPAEAGGGG
jgi:branched-chain amino acid transport system substrate-binding protein